MFTKSKSKASSHFLCFHKPLASQLWVTRDSCGSPAKWDAPTRTIYVASSFTLADTSFHQCFTWDWTCCPQAVTISSYAYLCLRPCLWHTCVAGFDLVGQAVLPAPSLPPLSWQESHNYETLQRRGCRNKRRPQTTTPLRLHACPSNLTFFFFFLPS